MYDFWLRVFIYFICFALSLMALTAIDFNRLVKKNASFNAQVLYGLIGIALAYLVGEFVMNIIYYFKG